ncbi:MAG: hypothetical protein ACE5H4_02610 [Candidatus Thorarchaeota archaeon]
MKLNAKNPETLLDSINVGVVMIDPDDRIVVFNRMAGETLQQDHGKQKWDLDSSLPSREIGG